MTTCTRTDAHALGDCPDYTTTTIPCGWCDQPVAVADDRGQVVYCSETHQRLDRYTPEAEGTI